MNGDDYSPDAGILWAAYKAGSFAMAPGLEQDAFIEQMDDFLGGFNQVWMVDDDNRSFGTGRGPVGIVLATIADLIVDARFGWFRWATPRNALRSSAAFFNMMRHSSKTGICTVRVPEARRSLPDHLQKYELLYFVGKVAPDAYLYSVRGRA